MREFDVALDRFRVYECGAELLTIMTSSDDAVSEERRGELFASLCGRALRQEYLQNPDETTEITVKRQYVFRDPKILDRDVRFVFKRLRHRLIAGRIALPFFQRAELGAMPPLPEGVKRLSINQLAEFVLNETGESEPTNVEKRTWAPSRSVIHLATATLLVLQEVGRRLDGQLTLDHFLSERVLIEVIVRRAQALEQLIERDPKFPIKASDLIKVRLV